ncbi:hypothetical protein BU25DRAFT_44829 [Macroventuria anomochaeta]|uniref:Uncharacterized protein n=1 Tax=Macroventuria anomochaeta TaxID=301207 RepID=A0ACB6S1K2_9PLEO|nr:uncharacterized protein BU25DRAFT_44829 [Macroventuria anomochaeta]KAF2627823.1 hypothetical protein BU25DRAFT_44829 [Macroventuria anomochaeta]
MNCGKCSARIFGVRMLPLAYCAQAFLDFLHDQRTRCLLKTMVKLTCGISVLGLTTLGGEPTYDANFLSAVSFRRLSARTSLSCTPMTQRSQVRTGLLRRCLKPRECSMAATGSGGTLIGMRARRQRERFRPCLIWVVWCLTRVLERISRAVSWREKIRRTIKS